MKKLALFLLLSTAVFAQNYRVDDVVTGRSGQPVPAATIAVCSQVPITAISEVVGTVTVTTTLNPPQGSTVTIVGVTPTAYNGSYLVLTTSPTSFTYTNPTQGLGAGTVFGSVVTTSSTPCAPLANLCSSYTDTVCASPNPVTGDGLGNYHFYVAPGHYTRQFYGTGLTARIQTDQIFPCDPANCSSGTVGGIVMADTQIGATLDVKLNACITAAQTKNPHICDARNVGNGTIAAQVDIGDNATATPVTLLLPTKATWTVTVTGGTACGIMVHDKGNMIGDPAGQGIDMVIAAGATANVDSLVCTDPAPIGGGTYGHIGGFLVQSALGGTVVTAALNIQKTFDNFLAERITANCQGCVGVYTHNLCCGLVMRGIQSDGSNVAGSKPCVIGNTGENTSSIHFADEFNCVHPGNGNAAMIVQGTTTWTQLISWDSIYLEPNQADTTTALASFTGSNGPFLIGQIRAGNFGVGPNNYLIDATSVQGLTVLQAIVPPSGNAINDHVHTVTITGTSNQTVGPYGWGNVALQFWLTKLTVANGVDAALSNTINCGLTTAETCTLDFLDHGTAKYSIQKDNSNNFVVFNSAAATSQLTYNAAGNATYNAPTGQSHAFEINGSVVGRFNSTGLVINPTISSLNGVTTADYGVAAIQGTPQHLTGQVGNLGATNLYAAAPPAGVYRVCFDAFTTTSGTGTTMTVSIGWTDAGGAKTFTSATWALNSVTITGYVDGCKIINSSGAANITVSTTGTIGTSAYAIDAMAERMK